MTFDYCSDLHLEFFRGKTPDFEAWLPNSSDVLLVAGDICTYLSKPEKILEDNKIVVDDFFKFVSKHYKHVVLVFGNHDYWGDEFLTAIRKARKTYPNIHILDKDFVEIGGAVIVGGTMWTDVPLDKQLMVQRCMNDYRYIEYHGKFMNINHTQVDNSQTIKAIKRVVLENKNKPVVVLTHHTPSFQSCDPKHSNVLDVAYCNNLDNWIFEQSNIKAWVHGHVHNKNDYMIGQCRVLSNPHGYQGQEVDSKNYRLKQFEI